MRRFLRRLRRFFLLLTALLLLFALPAYLRLCSLVRPVAEDRARLLTESILTEAAAACAREGLFSYEALMHLRYGSEGELLSLSPDAAMLHLLCADYMSRVNALLADPFFCEAAIPLGSIWASELFASWGPSLPLRLTGHHTLRATPVHSWEEAGINQSLHSVMLQVEGEVSMLLSGQVVSIPVSRSLPVCQTLLMGKVPAWRVPT